MLDKEIEKEVLKFKELVNSDSWEDKEDYEKFKRMGCKFEYDYKDPSTKTGLKIKSINGLPADLSDMSAILNGVIANDRGHEDNLEYFYNRVNFFRLGAINNMVRWYDNLPHYKSLGQIYERAFEALDWVDENDRDKSYAMMQLEKMAKTISSIEESIPIDYEYYLKINKIYGKVKKVIDNEENI